MKAKQQSFTIWYVIAAFLALFLVQALVLAPHVENLSYSEFKSLVAKDKVSSLVIGKQVITGTLAANGLEGLLPKEKIDELERYGGGVHRFVTARVDDPGLVGELEAAHVTFTGSVENTWLTALLSWVVPALVFVGLWALVMRRMGNTQSGLDAIGKARGVSPVMGGHDEREQTLNQLLAEMDGFDTQKGVILLAATNRPEILDPALLRPGRFDRQVAIDRPDLNGREKILKVHTRTVTLAPGLDLATIAARTIGFVGADLANLVNEAALRAARQDKDAIDMTDFDEAIDRIVAGLERKSRVISPREKEIVAYHEAGHALVAESRPHTDRVAKVSIIPRGVAALGYTQQLPVEDRYLMTRAELADRLDVLLGGRVAEELIFGDVSTGASDDLRRATVTLVRSHEENPASFAREAVRVGPPVGDSGTLWRLAEVVDVPVDQPRSIRQQCTQVHDRVGEMALGIRRHVVVVLGVLTTPLRCTLLGSSCFGKNAKGPVARRCAFLRKLRRPLVTSSANLLETDESGDLRAQYRTPAMAQGEGK